MLQPQPKPRGGLGDPQVSPCSGEAGKPILPLPPPPSSQTRRGLARRSISTSPFRRSKQQWGACDSQQRSRFCWSANATLRVPSARSRPPHDAVGLAAAEWNGEAEGSRGEQGTLVATGPGDPSSACRRLGSCTVAPLSEHGSCPSLLSFARSTERLRCPDPAGPAPPRGSMRSPRLVRVWSLGQSRAVSLAASSHYVAGS